MKPLILALLICLSAPLWAQHDRKPTSAERAAFTAALDALKLDATQESSWKVVESMPRDFFLGEMVTNLPSQRQWPDLYEGLRNQVLKQPDWDTWLGTRMEKWRSQVEAKEEGWSEPYNWLHRSHEFLWMISTKEAVALLAPYVAHPIRSGQNASLAFQRATAGKLFSMQIPGGPDSWEIEDWQKWWKENEALYKAGNGPEPTRRAMPMGRELPMIQPRNLAANKPSLPWIDPPSGVQKGAARSRELLPRKVAPATVALVPAAPTAEDAADFPYWTIVTVVLVILAIVFAALWKSRKTSSQ